MTASPVLLLTPNWRWDTTPLSTDTLCPPPSPPLEMAYIAAGLPDVRFIDAYAGDLSLRNLGEKVADLGPQVIVISTAPSALYWRCPPMTVEATAAALRACRLVGAAHVVVIGPHGMASPEWTLRTTGADSCFRGAPERLLAASLLRSDVSGPHLHTSARPATVCVEPAHSLPRSRADIFDLDLAGAYPPHMWCVSAADRRIADDLSVGALAESSRGCPWQCVYCAKAPVRDRYGRRDVTTLREEWQELASLGVEYVFLIDETFNLGGKRLDAVLCALCDSGLRFGFQGRPELVDAAQATALADAGCVYAELGIDINAAELSTRAGRRQSPQEAWAGVEALADQVPVVRYNRLNLATLDYRTKLSLDDGTSWDVAPDPAYPYPGAPLGDLVMRLHGYETFDWEFALRYSWWLRLEVAAQRAGQLPDDDELSRQQAAFLALEHDVATEVARQAKGVQIDRQFAEANKLVEAR